MGADITVKMSVIQQGVVTALPPPEEGETDPEPVIND